MKFALKDMVDQADSLHQVRKADLKPGDEIRLRTRNSVYIIKVEGDGTYIVSGGWFDRMSLSPVKTSINGCTWGGNIIKTDIIAACGLYLEFGNKLLTSVITEIVYFPGEIKN